MRVKQRKAGGARKGMPERWCLTLPIGRERSRRAQGAPERAGAVPAKEQRAAKCKRRGETRQLPQHSAEPRHAGGHQGKVDKGAEHDDGANVFTAEPLAKHERVLRADSDDKRRREDKPPTKMDMLSMRLC
jgi:hypothetical protein